jgi:histidyl-tRNA synthetase
LADVEVIALAIDVCRELGLTAADCKVRLSDRTVIHALLVRAGLPADRFADVLMVRDKLDRVGKAATVARLGELGLSDHSENILRVASVRSRDELNALATEQGSEPTAFMFSQVLDGLDTMGLSDFVEVDFSIVRGLAYYTGTVFELFDRQGTFRAICGGGRYDTLLASLGGVDLPAVGFGMGDVVLGELLKDRGLRPGPPASIDCYLAAFEASDLPTVLRIAHELRDAGVAAEYALVPAAIGKQLRTASARGAKVAIVVGPDDRARGELQIKDLRTTQQEAVPLDQVVARCLGLLTSTG